MAAGFIRPSAVYKLRTGNRKHKLDLGGSTKMRNIMIGIIIGVVLTFLYLKFNVEVSSMVQSLLGVAREFLARGDSSQSVPATNLVKAIL